jgi:hypothetical protein
MSIELISSTSDTVTVTMSKTELLILSSRLSSNVTDMRYGRSPQPGNGKGLDDEPLFDAQNPEIIEITDRYHKDLITIYDHVK